METEAAGGFEPSAARKLRMKHLQAISKTLPPRAVYSDPKVTPKVQRYLNFREEMYDTSPYYQVKYP